MPTVIEVTAASRLHFGMFSFGRHDARQFGGMGAMISAPGLRLRISPADKLSVTGPLADRALKVAWQLIDALPEFSEAGQTCQIEIVTAPREHVGLGVGTQLALATVAGIRRFLELPDLPPRELAATAGRGLRSAVGTYGFFQGGWIVESGKQLGDQLSPLVNRLDVPDRWRFVLIIPKQSQGLHGPDERRAFAELPPVPAEVTERLTRIATNEVVPALETADFNRVSEHLYFFNHEAGLCFAARQHGAYANEATTKLVEMLRSWDVAGVGQSSWGPSVFALASDENSATQLIERLRRTISENDYEFVLAPPANGGAKIIAMP